MKKSTLIICGLAVVAGWFLWRKSAAASAASAASAAKASTAGPANPNPLQLATNIVANAGNLADSIMGSITSGATAGATFIDSFSRP
jgi:hypothetical protein